ncbi:twin-arginine translocation signal domain-containing protein [Azotobacter chroococcum]|uniref:twin-arginine translocation signal domain-containing protein n=1 Tax=Azotobacter chroococcum TaxID=353 RepID=UPI0009E5D5C6
MSSRRDFLKTVAITTAGLSLVSLHGTVHASGTQAATPGLVSNYAPRNAFGQHLAL